MLSRFTALRSTLIRNAFGSLPVSVKYGGPGAFATLGSRFASTLTPTGAKEAANSIAIESQKRKARKKRVSGKTPLAKIAHDAEVSQLKRLTEWPPTVADSSKKSVTAYCVAQEYDLNQAQTLLQQQGIAIGVSGTILYPDEPQVIHVELPIKSQDSSLNPSSKTPQAHGDVFIFPSGTVVGWGLPMPEISVLADTILSPAARDPVGENAEFENLDYVEDGDESKSTIRGETIMLGTKTSPYMTSKAIGSADPRTLEILAKIAFSSGLARATKISVLENLVDDYFESTRSILATLKGKDFGLRSRRDVYEKIGQLLDLRAQLNLYSELTDHLPDLFWDTRQELGMENYYDQVGRVLDTEIRIKALNQKMDYGESIVHTLRDMRSEIHSSRLEKIIILLIMSEILLVIWTEFRIPAIAEGIGKGEALADAS